jgi:threonine dehydrogenase-like Zn-dependent dehydrogenase
LVHFAQRGDDGVEAVKELTNGIGADSVLECVGTNESVVQALKSARPGGMVGWVGVPHVSDIPQAHMFWRNVGRRGGPAPVRAYLPDLLDRVLSGHINLGKVFDLTLALVRSRRGVRRDGRRRAIKTMLMP